MSQRLKIPKAAILSQHVRSVALLCLRLLQVLLFWQSLMARWWRAEHYVHTDTENCVIKLFRFCGVTRELKSFTIPSFCLRKLSRVRNDAMKMKLRYESLFFLTIYWWNFLFKHDAICARKKIANKFNKLRGSLKAKREAEHKIKDSCWSKGKWEKLFIMLFCFITSATTYLRCNDMVIYVHSRIDNKFFGRLFS